MLNWLTRQRQQLHGFYRDGFGRAFGMTALAFAVVMVVSYLVTLRYPAPIERLIKLFREQIADRGIVDAEGNFSALGLFLNNLQACALAMGYGFIPFLYLPAVSLGINAMMFGGFASYYVQLGLPCGTTVQARCPTAFLSCPPCLWPWPGACTCAGPWCAMCGATRRAWWAPQY